MKSQLLQQHPTLPARVLCVETAHGSFETPVFMPVATRAYVNHLSPERLSETGSQIILGGNTYHMLVAPGTDVIQHSGGMHRFMNWHGPMLTDSGGFQVFSLSGHPKNCQIDDQGARFRHPSHGGWLHLDAQQSIETQKIIGADIIMAFDQCMRDDDTEAERHRAIDRTRRWLETSIHHHQKQPNSKYGHPQALFGIIQGGFDQTLRLACAQDVIEQPVDGVAIGGQSIGFDMEKTRTILQWLAPKLPSNRPIYTMGVGMFPQDLIDAAQYGVDMFDCVAPTRNARHGSLYSGSWVETNGWLKFESEYPRGRLLIKQAQFTNDQKPIMEDCDCRTCQYYTRAYLQHLFKQNATYYRELACQHNLRVMHKTTELIRSVIRNADPAAT